MFFTSHLVCLVFVCQAMEEAGDPGGGQQLCFPLFSGAFFSSSEHWNPHIMLLLVSDPAGLWAAGCSRPSFGEGGRWGKSARVVQIWEGPGKDNALGGG